MPFDGALEVAETRLKTETIEALRHAQLCWHEALSLYSMGGKPSDCPQLEDDEDDE
jgi:hypothetical protein